MTTSEAQSRIELRIFVVGVPRSGTTLVQSLLAAHSALTSFTESHFFSRYFSLMPGSLAVLTKDPTPRLREFLAENDVAPDLAQRLLGASAQRPLSLKTRAVARHLLGVFDELATSRGTSGWIEKTPKHLRYIPFLERLYGRDERPHVVHVIRDGLDTVSSLHQASRHWERHYDLEECVQRWNDEVAFSLARADRDHIVFYEDLTARPAEVLQGLLADLGLDWQPEILDRYGEAAGRLITDEESWKANVGGGVRRASTSTQWLTKEQRDQVRQGLRQDLYTTLREQTLIAEDASR